MSEETLLVVGDNHHIASVIENRLISSKGYKLLVATSGKSALAIVRARPVSLMVLEQKLTDISGLELLRQLSSEGRSVPTILIADRGSEQIAVDAFRLGVQDYLSTPLEPEKLDISITHALSDSRLRHEKSRLTMQLKEQVSWLGTLSKVGNSVTSTLELDEVLRRIIEAGVQLTHADEGFLALLDEGSGQLYLRAVKNIEEDKIKTLRLPVTDTMLGSVLRSMRPLRTTQASNSPLLKVSTGYLVHSLLHVPLISRGRALGVLSVDNRFNVHPFKEIDEAMLISLADYASVAIENAKLYQQAQQEIVDRKKAEEALRESEERYELAVRGANDGLWDWNLKENTIYFSPRWKTMLGYDEEEITDNPKEWSTRIHPEDLEYTMFAINNHIKGLTTHFESEHRMFHRDGEYRWMLTRGMAVWDEDGVATRLAGSQSDIHDRKLAEQRLLHDAFHDTLTGLPNRALFVDRLESAIKRANQRTRYLYAVLYLDLDRFKDVNDSLGHMMGDQLLIAVARRLELVLRSTDSVARLGGDEFVLLLEDMFEASDATDVADRVNKEFEMPFILENHEVYITTSIGIVLSETGYQRAEDVLRDADIAMYRAKAKGKARYEIFDPDMRNRIMERLMMETKLRQAIENGELRVFYQPIVSLQTGKLVSMEALVRWQHPERGLLPPGEFIPLAEETSLIIPLDRWVLREACRQMHEWHDLYPTNPLLAVSVNLSGKQLIQPDLVEAIDLILQETGLDPKYLKLEITESAIMERDSLTEKSFNRLREMGVQMQIDDFGVGYSSLGYLAFFTINAVKIDRSFISKITNGGSHPKIVQAIVMLAHALGMDVIAEGLETEEQLVQVRSFGCEYGQGYLLMKPVDSEHIKGMITKAQSGERFVKLTAGNARKDGSVRRGEVRKPARSDLGADLSVAVPSNGVNDRK